MIHGSGVEGLSIKAKSTLLLNTFPLWSVYKFCFIDTLLT